MHSVCNDMVLVSPNIIFAARRQGLPLNALRLWFLAKHFAGAEAGFVPKKIFRQKIEHCNLYFFSHYQVAMDMGLLHEFISAHQEHMVHIASWQEGMVISGADAIGHWAFLPLDKFCSTDWVPYVWERLIEFHDGVLNRQTLESITGIPRRTQTRWERRVSE